MNKMCVIVFPTSNARDELGKYARMEYLYFRRQEDALKCLAEQDYVDGHEWYEVPYFHGGFLVRYNKVLYSWEKQFINEAEDFAAETNQKLIVFSRSWLE